MYSVPVLELRTLPTIHPKASILLDCGTSTIVRLSLDPTELPSGTMDREVIVDWLSLQHNDKPQDCIVKIGWTDVPQLIMDGCETWTATKNAPDITEQAAIGVMALLIHHLEKAEIQCVLQIGSGGDYLLVVNGLPPMQIESSGIYEDPQGSRSSARLKDKSVQVLTNCTTGFASVVAFSHSPNRDVYCKLHYVTKDAMVEKKSPVQNRSPKNPLSRKKRK